MVNLPVALVFLLHGFGTGGCTVLGEGSLTPYQCDHTQYEIPDLGTFATESALLVGAQISLARETHKTVIGH